MKSQELKGKKLLFIDGSLCVIEAIRMAKAQGIKTVVANYYPSDISPAKLYADEAVDIDFSDYPAMIEMIKERNIDGFFQGWTDSHLPVYYDICKLMNWPCYGTREQFEICINKKRFKETCQKYSIPMAKEYQPVFDQECNLLLERMEKIDYPVITKPADNSGSRGIYISNTPEELKKNFKLSMHFSPGRTVLIEEYVRGRHVNMYYTFAEGKHYLSAMADRYVDYLNYQSAPLPVLLVHPSEYLAEYEQKVDPYMRKMFETLGMNNGIAFVQGFRKENGDFVVYEIGYRPNGGSTYALIEACSGYNQIEMLIRFALTGKMGEEDALEASSPHFKKNAYMFVLSTETRPIAEMKGLEVISGWDNVVAVIPDRFPPEKSVGEGSHARIAAYILFTETSQDGLRRMLERIYRTVQLKDENGREMKIKKIDISTMTIDT